MEIVVFDKEESGWHDNELFQKILEEKFPYFLEGVVLQSDLIDDYYVTANKIIQNLGEKPIEIEYEITGKTMILTGVTESKDIEGEVRGIGHFEKVDDSEVTNAKPISEIREFIKDQCKQEGISDKEKKSSID